MESFNTSRDKVKWGVLSQEKIIMMRFDELIEWLIILIIDNWQLITLIGWCTLYLKKNFMHFIQWDLKINHPVEHSSWFGIFLSLTLSIKNSRKEFVTQKRTGRKFIFNFSRCPMLWSPVGLNLDHSQSLKEANIIEHISLLPPSPS